ncbi:NUDIX hydrolase [Natrialbaceae archaeon GCM10025810]|uniref:NUDIX hydrolase n=1 Tax=Halovalidus salilacus TaxID=3075124 RepID=UPI003608A522
MPADQLAWETLDGRVAYSCPGFDVINESVRLPDGTETDFDYLSDDPSVCVIPFTAAGSGGGNGIGSESGVERELVCIEEWRQAVSRVSYGLPVGGVEPDDDDLESAARRELAEETGYEAGTVEPLLTVEPANGIADSVLHVFVARGCRPTGEQRLDHNESIRARESTLEALTDAIAAGEIRDGRTVLAISYYRLFAE